MCDVQLQIPTSKQWELGCTEYSVQHVSASCTANLHGQADSTNDNVDMVQLTMQILACHLLHLPWKHLDWDPAEWEAGCSDAVLH